jgi:hypothetical protein
MSLSRFAIALLPVAVLATSLGVAAGDPPPLAPPPSPPTLTPEQVEGARLFDEAIRWVARGESGIQKANDFYVSLDAKFDLENQHHEGVMRLWFQAPDKYRQELSNGGATTTKILNGESLWIVQPNGQVSNENRRGEEGARAVAQAKDDRERLSDLTQFLTLQGLKGPGITFEFLGPKSGTPNTAYAGEWMKIKRTAPGRSDIFFWLAYQRDAAGKAHATWPGVVRVDGEPAKNIPTEDYILKEWQEPAPNQPRAFRWPRKIEAWQVGRAPVRFLFATVDDLKINAGIDPTRFAPPQPK